MRRGLRVLVTLLVIAAAVYIAAVGYLFLIQRQYVFQPTGSLVEPATVGLPGVEIVTLRMKDGTALTGWYQQAAPGKPTVLYFHGNGGNISDRGDRFRQIVGSGFGFLAISYRGYPGSGGSPSEAALVSDGLESFDWLAARTGAIVIHGESLGSAVAVAVAAKRAPSALILEAPFTAALDLAANAYPWVPTRLLMRDPFLSRERIKDVHAPLLIVHGAADAVVPVEEGWRLFALANEPKQLDVVEGASHIALWENGLWADALAFLAKTGVTPQPAAPAAP